jgi:hypothetical protein
MKTLLGLVRDRYNMRRLALAAFTEVKSNRRTIPVMPGRLNEDPAGVSVAALGDRTGPTDVSAAVLAGGKAKETHQFPWLQKSPELVKLSHQRYRRQSVDAAKTTKITNLLTVRLAKGELLQMTVKRAKLLLQLINQKKILRECHPVGLMVEDETTDPKVILLGPFRRAAVNKSKAEKKVVKTVTGTF